MAKAQRIQKDAASDRKASVQGAVMAVEAAATMLSPGGLVGTLIAEAVEHKDAIVEFGKKVYSEFKKNPKKAIKKAVHRGKRKAEKVLENAKKKIEKKNKEIEKDVRPDATDTRSAWDRAKDLIKKAGPLAVALAAAMRGGGKDARKDYSKPEVESEEVPHKAQVREPVNGRLKNGIHTKGKRGRSGLPQTHDFEVHQAPGGGPGRTVRREGRPTTPEDVFDWLEGGQQTGSGGGR
jgi:hypothetical protein